MASKHYEVRPHHADTGEIVDEAGLAQLRQAFGERTLATRYAVTELPDGPPAPLPTVDNPLLPAVVHQHQPDSEATE